MKCLLTMQDLVVGMVSVLILFCCLYIEESREEILFIDA